MESIFNTKIRVLNEKHSEEIQKKAFELGCDWLSGCNNVMFTSAKFLFISDDGKITFSHKEDWFNFQDNKEIYFYDGDFHVTPKIEARVVGAIHNAKIKVKNKDHSIQIQKKLFELGHSWSRYYKFKTTIEEGINDGYKKPRHTEASWLYIGPLGFITTDNYFVGYNTTEIYFYDGEFHYEPEQVDLNENTEESEVKTQFKNGDKIVSEKHGEGVVIGCHPDHPVVIIDTKDGLQGVAPSDLMSIDEYYKDAKELFDLYEKCASINDPWHGRKALDFYKMAEQTRKLYFELAKLVEIKK